MDYLGDLRNRAIAYDVGVIELDLESVDGCVMDGSKGYLIALDAKLGAYHKRFTFAHELGHITDGTVNSTHSRLSEYRATREGVDILVPDSDFMDALETYGGDYSMLCPIFGVTEEVLELKYKKLFYNLGKI